MSKVWHAGAIASAMAMGVALVGCGHSEAVHPLSPSMYYGQPQPIEENSAGEINRPTVVDAARAANEESHLPPEPLPNPTIIREPTTASATPASTQSSGDPATDPTAVAATPATDPTQSGVSTGTYLKLGCVIAEVNGKPVYANKVLSLNDVVLAANARQMDFTQFKAFAQEQIHNTITEQIRDELEFAAAQRLLSQDDQKMADALTQEWRRQRITEASGSIEKARKVALDEDGEAFDELVKDHYRTEMARIYYQRKINPRIQISGELMRQFYDRHTSLFCTNDKILFRLIKIDGEKAGSMAKAHDKAADIYKRLMAGADFEKICTTKNDDDHFRDFGLNRQSDWMGKGAFRFTEVADALFKLEPGKITEPIDSEGDVYIGKLIDRTIGQTHSFSEEAVQDHIRGILRTQQYRELQDEVQHSLQQGAIVQVDENSVHATVDMAMQKYMAWNKGR